MSRKKYKQHLVSEFDLSSPLLESYKQLRTNIEFSNNNDEIKVIMVASAKEGEGKSTTAANLAVTYAQANKKVLLVDADLRDPVQHLFFQLPNQVGLTSILSHRTNLKNVIAHTSVNGLDVIPSGPLPMDASEMIESKRLAEIVDELKPSYDVIIMDTTSLLISSDAQIVSTISDGVIMVIEPGKVKKKAILKAKESLDLVKARVLGAVFNNIEQKMLSSHIS